MAKRENPGGRVHCVNCKWHGTRSELVAAGSLRRLHCPKCSSQYGYADGVVDGVPVERPLHLSEIEERVRGLASPVCSVCGQELETLRERIYQYEVQMAGISSAAGGATRDPAKRGEYGWSPAYQDVVELRGKFELTGAVNGISGIRLHRDGEWAVVSVRLSGGIDVELIRELATNNFEHTIYGGEILRQIDGKV